MTATPALDPARVRRRFDRCAAGYDAAAVLAREVAARMLERLDLVRMQPARVLDLGSGTGFVAQNLNTRYVQAQVVAIDFSLAMLRAANPARLRFPGRRLWSRLGARRPLPVCAEMERLPLADASFDLACSNLALEWSARPHQVLQEVQRVLRGGGLFMFSTLGPDTLRELRSADPRGAAGTHRLADMHDVGDALVRQGFADPVMDMEHLTLTYPDVGALLQELRASGYAQAPQPVSAGLHGRGWLRELERRYAAFARDGRVPATFEIVYGHAWKPEQPAYARPDGSAVIRFVPRIRGDV